MLIGVIFLKSKILKNVLIIFLSGVIFLGVAYAYLAYNTNKKLMATEQKDSTVPYKSLPKNCGIVIAFPNDKALLAYLDFNENCIRLVNVEKYDSDCSHYYGYTADYTVKASYDLLQEMVDRVGGVDIEQNGTVMRYTGTQVVDLFSSGYTGNMRGQLISQIFKKISKNGFSKEDVIYLIENCETDISFIDCIYWIDYIKEMSDNVKFAN